MNLTEIKHTLRTIMDQMLSDGEAITYMHVVDGFMSVTDPTDLLDPSAELLADHLKRIARDLLKSKRTEGHGQLVLEGFGEFNQTITTMAEGTPVVKYTRFATAADLIEYERIQRENSEAARQAYVDIRQFNETVLPVMEANNCVNVGEALELMGFTGSGERRALSA